MIRGPGGSQSNSGGTECVHTHTRAHIYKTIKNFVIHSAHKYIDTFIHTPICTNTCMHSYAKIYSHTHQYKHTCIYVYFQMPLQMFMNTHTHTPQFTRLINKPSVSSSSVQLDSTDLRGFLKRDSRLSYPFSPSPGQIPPTLKHLESDRPWKTQLCA